MKKLLLFLTIFGCAQISLCPPKKMNKKQEEELLLLAAMQEAEQARVNGVMAKKRPEKTYHGKTMDGYRSGNQASLNDRMLQVMVSGKKPKRKAGFFNKEALQKHAQDKKTALGLCQVNELAQRIHLTYEELEELLGSQQ